jgi:ATP-dependent helicase/nuclease subunit A
LGGTLADAAASLDEDLESKDLDSIALEPGRSNVVRLMNLHKAKGLEAPVVFLADPTGGVTERVDIRIVRDGSHALGFFQLTRQLGEFQRTVLGEPADWAAHEAAELEYVRAEERRLLYVAATRAKDLLVVSRWAKSGGKSPRSWGLLDKYLAGTSELTIPAVTVPAPGGLPDLSPAARTAAQTAREERQRAAATPSWQVESVTATAHHAAPAGYPVQADRTREPDTGMAWGTLIHFLLENAMRGPKRDRSHLERLANWFTVDKPELRAVIPEALDTVEGVFESDFWRSAQAAQERHVEVPFAVKVHAEAGPPKILHGVIDLAFSTPAGWDLVDYKGDQITPGIPELVARYRSQVRTYGEHWSSLAAAPARTGLHFVRALAFAPKSDWSRLTHRLLISGSGFESSTAHRFSTG